MADMLSLVTTPLWAYVALWALLAADAFIPVLPTQAIMITSGVLAADGQLSLPVAIAVGAAGVLCGDVAWYLIGRSSHRFGPGRGILGRSRLTEHSAVRMAARFTRGLREPGPVVILLCRFVPGGRMATFFYAGRSRYSGRRFLVYESAAALGWAAYGGIVGHIGGAAVTRSAWQLVAIAAVAATLFAAAGWLLALAGQPGRNARATEETKATETTATGVAPAAEPATPGRAA